MEFNCHFSWQVLYLMGCIQVAHSVFVAGAEFGEVQVSFFVAGTAFGEIWHDSRSAKCCIFQYKMRVGSAKSNLSCAAGCRLWKKHIFKNYCYNLKSGFSSFQVQL